MKFENFNWKQFWGLDADSMISTGYKYMKVDLAFDKILLNIFPNDCELEVDCQQTSRTLQTDNYNGIAYSYTPARTFLSWAEIQEGMVESIDQYDSLRAFDIRYIQVDKKKTNKGTNIGCIWF